MTQEEKLTQEQTNIDFFDKTHHIIDDIIVYKGTDFTRTCKILDIAVSVNTDIDWVKLNNHEYKNHEYKYTFRAENLYTTAFYTKEKADEYLVKFLEFISKKNI